MGNLFYKIGLHHKVPQTFERQTASHDEVKLIFQSVPFIAQHYFNTITHGVQMMHNPDPEFHHPHAPHREILKAYLASSVDWELL